jgi:hypothetical protein
VDHVSAYSGSTLHVRLISKTSLDCAP